MKRLFLLLVSCLFVSLCFSQKTDSSSNWTGQQKIYSLDEEYNFQIRLTNDSLTATLNLKKLPISNIQGLEDYLELNIQNINKEKVLLDISPKTSINRIKALKGILAKYKIYNYFKVMSE